MGPKNICFPLEACENIYFTLDNLWSLINIFLFLQPQLQDFIKFCLICTIEHDKRQVPMNKYMYVCAGDI